MYAYYTIYDIIVWHNISYYIILLEHSRTFSNRTTSSARINHPRRRP